MQKEGIQGYQDSPYRDWKKDIALCRSIREAVGEETILMLDPFVAYSRDEALKVGKEIQKLNFYWYEAPIPTEDVGGLENLCASLDIQVLTGEQLTNLSQYGDYIRRHATDALRCIDTKAA